MAAAIVRAYKKRNSGLGKRMVDAAHIGVAVTAPPNATSNPIGQGLSKAIAVNESRDGIDKFL